MDGLELMRPARRRLLDVLVCGALAIGVLLVAPSVLGYETYVIAGDSMSGSYDRGTLLIEESVPVSSLRVGDVITFSTPSDAGLRAPVTHRIAWIGRNALGRPIMRTKGDANARADAWTFSVDGPRQARAVLGVPYVGYVLGALGDRNTRILAIGLPALLIALATLAGLWRDAGEDVRGSRTSDSAVAGAARG